MTDHPEPPPSDKLGRRRVLRAVGLGLTVVPIAHALGCNGVSMAPGDAGSALDAAGGGGDAGAVPSGWATGGTVAMVAAASYPNPFEGGAGSSCALTCAATIGPCHTTSPMRSDVSDGWDGLPVRLALRVVDASCAPVEGVIVEIWHTNHRGIYSGEINSMCNSAAEDRAAGYFRGYQVTDADGRVDFDTVFPGWYTSRAVHIHFRVMTGAYDPADGAAATVVSQLFFSDELVTSIFESEPLYRDYGLPDTWLTTDNVVGGEDDPSPVLCDVARMSDGVMLASKTLTVDTASDAGCNLQGAGGGGGGPPPRF